MDEVTPLSVLLWIRVLVFWLGALSSWSWSWFSLGSFGSSFGFSLRKLLSVSYASTFSFSLFSLLALLNFFAVVRGGGIPTSKN